MKHIINNPELIAACGLYCAACVRFRKGRCAGCSLLDANSVGPHRPLARSLQRCHIRKCCRGKGFHTCAECYMDVRECKTHNNFLGRVFSVFFGTDRAAGIRYIRRQGEDAYAEKMAWEETMAIRRK